MALLDNQPVTIDDKVFYIIWGYGIVTSTMFGSIQVRFGDNRAVKYESDGSLGGVRRLYWHNPVVIPPPRDNRGWETLQSVLTTVAAHLKL